MDHTKYSTDISPFGSIAADLPCNLCVHAKSQYVMLPMPVALRMNAFVEPA